jgi:catechol 2,3-dioxygenase-like lactoylglutathione lyase family enzyme
VTTQFDRRTFLLTVPALFASRAFAQVPAAFKVNGLSQIVLTVSNIRQSLEFYQGLFGMPIQARQGSTVLLKVGVGPRFLALRQAADGERPSISALGFGVENFSVDGAMKTLSAHGLQRPASPARGRRWSGSGVRTRAARAMAARATCLPRTRAGSCSSCMTLPIAAAAARWARPVVQPKPRPGRASWR